MQEQIDNLKNRVGNIETTLGKVVTRQDLMVDRHYELEKELVDRHHTLENSVTKISSDLSHVKGSVDDIRTNINGGVKKVIYTLLVGFVAFIIAGKMGVM